MQAQNNSTDHSETTFAIQVEEMDALTESCPLSITLKKRGLNERWGLLYAPMAAVGGLLYDKDAVYIDNPDWKVSSQPAAFGLPLSNHWVL